MKKTFSFASAPHLPVLANLAAIVCHPRTQPLDLLFCGTQVGKCSDFSFVF